MGKISRLRVVVDCFEMLDDHTIRHCFELGCRVKGLEPGHVVQIKDEVEQMEQ